MKNPNESWERRHAGLSPSDIRHAVAAAQAAFSEATAHDRVLGDQIAAALAAYLIAEATNGAIGDEVPRSMLQGLLVQHRTLQDLTVRALVRFLSLYAQVDDSQVDPRNAGAREIARNLQR